MSDLSRCVLSVDVRHSTDHCSESVICCCAIDPVCLFLLHWCVGVSGTVRFCSHSFYSHRTIKFSFRPCLLTASLHPFKPSLNHGTSDWLPSMTCWKRGCSVNGCGCIWSLFFLHQTFRSVCVLVRVSLWLSLSRSHTQPQTQKQKQLPSETKSFQEVDRFWRELMRKCNANPVVMTCVQASNVRENLEKYNKDLEKVCAC